MYYIGSYSQAHAPALRRDVYLSIDQINTYLNQMADTDRDYIIIQDPLPDYFLSYMHLDGDDDEPCNPPASP